MIKNGKITIFENGVTIDRKLPKYKVEESNNFRNRLDGTSDVSFGSPSEGVISGNWNRNDQDTYMCELLESKSFTQPSIVNKLKVWVFKKLYMSKSHVNSMRRVSPETIMAFFDSIKKTVNDLDKKHIDDVLKKYSITLENAENNNQIALAERIKDFAIILKFELLLSTTKFNKYLTEEQISKFYDMTSVHERYKTNLHLTYIKNFLKVIPENVTELKKEADTLKVFDNYVILHYDYNGKSIGETKAEEAKRKDPILFGVIQNSRKLYYIGDWVDEYCDLTLDVIIKRIGDKSKTINTSTLKKSIEQI